MIWKITRYLEDIAKTAYHCALPQSLKIFLLQGHMKKLWEAAHRLFYPHLCNKIDYLLNRNGTHEAQSLQHLHIQTHYTKAAEQHRGKQRRAD